MISSVEKAKPLLERKSLIYLTLTAEHDESLQEICGDVARLGCHTIKHSSRNEVTIIPAGSPAITLISLRV